jgi:hypothetical protein
MVRVVSGTAQKSSTHTKTNGTLHLLPYVWKIDRDVPAPKEYTEVSIKRQEANNIFKYCQVGTKLVEDTCTLAYWIP